LLFPHADRLFVPVSENVGRNIRRANVTFADYEDWRREVSIFAEVALYRATAGDLSGDGEPERVRFAFVTERYFALVDVVPIAGRVLGAADFQVGAPTVAVIGERLWRRRFGGRPDIVGRTATLGGVAREIVGVLPERRVWPDESELWLPIAAAALDQDARTRRDNMIFGGLARLRDDVSPDRANALVASIAERLAREQPASRQGWTNALVPLREFIVNPELARALYMLLGAVAGVLLIACANVANLTLVRGSGRSRELAVRLSLGASRRHLIQQLLIESVLLACIAAALGLALAVLMMNGLIAIAPVGTPFVEDIALNWRVVVAALAAGALAAIISGLIPAFSISSMHLTNALRDGSAGGGAAVRSARLRNVLVVAEIAAAVILVIGSALLVRSFAKLSRVDTGVAVDRVAMGRIAIPGSRYPTAERRAKFGSDIVAALESSADVETAALTSYAPAGGGGGQLGRVFLPEGRPEPPAGADVGAAWNVVTPHYFATLGIPIVSGRAFGETDTAKSTPVMIVSRSFARRMFGTEPALGRRVRSWRDENVLREIVGVVEDVKYTGPADRERPLIYVPHTQDSPGGMVIVARSRSGNAGALTATIRRVVGSLDGQLAVAQLRTLSDAANASIASQRYATLLLSMLAAAALTLAALGIFGVTSYVFALRRRELGIRLALGASRGNLYALVFRHGFRLTATGLALGLAGGIGVAGWLRTLLFETAPSDPIAWVGMAVTVAVAATLACVLPARRAADADPKVALQAE
jgi:predicted permease